MGRRVTARRLVRSMLLRRSGHPALALRLGGALGPARRRVAGVQTGDKARRGRRARRAAGPQGSGKSTAFALVGNSAIACSTRANSVSTSARSSFTSAAVGVSGVVLSFPFGTRSASTNVTVPLLPMAPNGTPLPGRHRPRMDSVLRTLAIPSPTMESAGHRAGCGWPPRGRPPSAGRCTHRGSRLRAAPDGDATTSSRHQGHVRRRSRRRSGTNRMLPSGIAVRLGKAMPSRRRTSAFRTATIGRCAGTARKPSTAFAARPNRATASARPSSVASRHRRCSTACLHLNASGFFAAALHSVSFAAFRLARARRSPCLWSAPLDRADKRRAVELTLKAWPDRSQRRVAAHVGCSQRYVAKIDFAALDRTQTERLDSRPRQGRARSFRG